MFKNEIVANILVLKGISLNSYLKNTTKTHQMKFAFAFDVSKY